MDLDPTQTYNGSVLNFKGQYYAADGINGAAVMRLNGYNPSIPIGNSSITTPQNNSDMWPLIAAAGASIIGGLIGGAINANQSKKAQQRQARIQKEQFDYTNEYNLPIHQVQRLMDAGLNPNLLYGSSHPTGNTAGMPSVGSAQPAKVDLQSAIKYSLDAMRLEKENRLVDQQIENMRQQNRALSLDNAEKEAEQPYFEENARNKSSLLRVQRLIQENENVIKTNQAQRSNLQQDVYNQLVDEGLMFDIERDKFLMDQQTYRIALQQEKYVKKQIAKIDREMINLAKEGRILEYKARLADSGVNPDDPIWARAIGLFIDSFMKYFGLGGTVGAIQTGARKTGEYVDYVRTPVKDLINNGLGK